MLLLLLSIGNREFPIFYTMALPVFVFSYLGAASHITNLFLVVNTSIALTGTQGAIDTTTGR